MPKIKPISDLRNYSEVLRDVAAGEPVFLTKNGRGRFAIMDMADYENIRERLKLMEALSAGERSIAEEGLIPAGEVRAYVWSRVHADED